MSLYHLDRDPNKSRFEKKTMDFSADASTFEIKLSFLQPFELASVTGLHTESTYDNAAEFGSAEYLMLHSHLCTNFERILPIAAMHNRTEIISLLIKLGARDLDHALYSAANCDQPAAIQELVRCGARDIKNALRDATRRGNLASIKVLVKLGATNFTNAIWEAQRHKQKSAETLLVGLQTVHSMRQV